MALGGRQGHGTPFGHPSRRPWRSVREPRGSHFPQISAECPRGRCAFPAVASPSHMAPRGTPWQTRARRHRAPGTTWGRSCARPHSFAKSWRRCGRRSPTKTPPFGTCATNGLATEAVRPDPGGAHVGTDTGRRHGSPPDAARSCQDGATGTAGTKPAADTGNAVARPVAGCQRHRNRATLTPARGTPPLACHGRRTARIEGRVALHTYYPCPRRGIRV